MTDKKTLPPGMRIPVSNGYNALKAKFSNKAIFTPSFSKGKTVKYGAAQAGKASYAIPDHIAFKKPWRASSAGDTVLLRKKEDYDKYFSAPVKAEYASLTFADAAQSDLAFHGSLFAEADRSYIVNSSALLAYSIQRKDADELTQEFSDALAGLPLEFSQEAKGRKDFFDFFDAFGTHYLKTGRFGGFMAMESSIANHLFDKLKEAEIIAGVKAGFGGLMKSGRMDAVITYKASKFLGHYKDQISITIYTSGGVRRDSIRGYFQTIPVRPILLTNTGAFGKTEFVSMGNLIKDEARRKAFNKAVEAYISGGDSGGSAISAGKIQDMGGVYRTPADSLVLGTLQMSASGQADFRVFSGDSSALSAMKGCCSVSNYPSFSGKLIGNQVCYSSFLVPVRRGDYYAAKKESMSGAPDCQFLEYALLSRDTPAIGEWQVIDTDAPIKAASDGFVIAAIDCVRNLGSQGAIFGRISCDAKSYTDIAAASACRSNEPYTCFASRQSFCMPVRKGESYIVKTETKDAKPEYQAFWAPLSERISLFQAPVLRLRDSVYKALSDGLLTVMVKASDTDGLGYIEVKMAAELSNIDSTPVVRTSVHAPVIIYNNVTVPVHKGYYYKIVANVEVGALDISGYWHPMSVLA